MTADVVLACLGRLAIPSSESATSFLEQKVAADLQQRRLFTTWQWEQIQHGITTFFLDHDRYLLLSQIGQGGMGAVYRARHLGLRRDVALKVLDPRKGVSPEQIDRFRREVSITSRLQHEHIVQALDVGSHGGVTFLVLEFVDGADLAAVVKRNGPFDPGVAAAICVQAASGLAYAHSQGIVHRDIKPQNILLSLTGVTKILDLGLARVVDAAGAGGADVHTSLTQEGSIMGTVDYMSPEQARDIRSVDARSDLYSLGGTLYYLLAGRPPFPGGTVLEKLMRLAQEQPEPLGQLRPDLPRELTDIVVRMLAKRPTDRFQSAEDVVRALQPLAAATISGTSVITRAVQLAANTQSGNAAIANGAAADFSPQVEVTSVLSDLRTRQQRSGGFGNRAAVIAGACGLLLLVLLGVFFSRGRDSDRPSAVQRTATTAVKPPAEPPSEYRVERADHYAGVWSIAFSPERNEITTGGGEGLILIRDWTGGHLLKRYQAHHEPVVNLVWSADGRLLASRSYLGEICIWDGRVEPLARVRSSGIDSQRLAFSPDGKELAYADESGLRTIRWDFRNDRVVAVHDWTGSGALVNTCYSHDGKWLASASENGDLRVWNLESGVRFFHLDRQESAAHRCVTNFLPDGKLLMARGAGIEIWDCEQQQRVQEIPASLGMYAIPVLALSSSGQCLFGTESGVSLLDWPSGKASVVSSTSLKVAGQRPVMAFSPDLSLFAGGSDYPCSVLEISTGRVLATFKDRSKGVANPTCLGMHNVSLEERGLWNLLTAEPLEGSFEVPRVRDDDKVLQSIDQGVILPRILEGKGPTSRTPNKRTNAAPRNPATQAPVTLQDYAGEKLFWSAYGDFVFGASTNGDLSINVWNATSGNRVWKVPAALSNRDRIWGQSLNADADSAAIASSDSSGKILVSSRDATRPPLEIQTPIRNGTLHCVMAPDSTRIVAWDSMGETFLYYDGRSGRLLAEVKTGVPANIIWPTFSASSRYLLTSRQIWDLQTPSIPTLVWEAPPDHAPWWPHRGAGWFPDEVHVAINQDSQVQFWDWQKNVKLATLFLLPDDEWAFVNHLTHHARLSLFANRHLRCLFRDASDKERWLSPADYAKASSWKNGPEQAGIDLSNKPSNIKK